MLFRTYEPYEEDIIMEKEDNEPNLCFICYEGVNNNNELPIKLNLNIYYFKECVCDGFIHKICLDKWHTLNKSCPICRRDLLFKNREYTVSVLNYYGVFIVVNKFYIYIFKLEKIIHLSYFLRIFYYILFNLYYCIKIYVLISFVYLLSFFLVISLRDTLS